MVSVPRGEFFTTDYTDCTDFLFFFRVNSRYSRLILARPCEIPKSQRVFYFQQCPVASAMGHVFCEPIAENE